MVSGAISDAARPLLDVVERVLRDVADPRVRVLPDGPRRRLDLARQALDERRLARAVRADARDARRERHLDRGLLDGDLVVARVLEGDVDDLDEGLALGFDACVGNCRETAARCSRAHGDAAAASKASRRRKLKFFHADSPSIGPGFGKWNLSLFDLSSK